MWPAAVGEQADQSLVQHVANCEPCRLTIQRLQSEIRTLQEATVPWLPAPAHRSPAGEVTPPRTIGKYQVVEVLGIGGQGAVYRAWNPDLGREVAIKIGKQPLSNSSRRNSLIQEGRRLAGLEHPHLAKVLDIDFDQDRPFVVLEYVRGVNLAQYARSRSLAPRELALLLAQAARAVHAAHLQGIWHLDLKPQNILIKPNGEPLVIDFGLAKVSDAWSGDSSPADSVTGTPQYMAPEQARGNAEQASDVFGLGAVLYFLLTRRPPFDSQDIYEALRRAQSCELDADVLRNPPAGVPRRLAQICLKALSPRPQDRQGTAEELAQDLERFAHRPRYLRYVAAIGVLLLLFVGFIDRTRRPEPIPPKPTFSLQVLGDAGARELVKATPVRNGNRLQILGQFPAGYQVAVFLLTADGRLQHLEDLELVERDSTVKAAYRGEFSGTPGTDVLFICGRATSAITEQEVRECLGDLVSPWPLLSPLLSVEFDPDLAWISGSRDLKKGQTPEDPVVSQADALRQALAGRFEFIQGVAFPRREQDE